MASKVRMGYRGLASIGDTKLRCTSFNINPNQDVLFYNHVMGLKDKLQDDKTKTKQEDLDSTYANVQRKIWRPSPISITGGMAFPATKKNLKDIFDLARYANYFDIIYQYYCANSDNARKFIDCRINTFDFNIIAGDILNLSLDVACKNLETASNNTHYTEAEKLITWDRVEVSLEDTEFDSDGIVIQGINFKINNNLQTIYTTTSETNTTSSLLPTDIRVGMQEITGTLSIYFDRGYNFIPINLNKVAKVKIDTGDAGLDISMDVVFKPNTLDGDVGPIVIQLPFVGVDYTFS